MKKTASVAVIGAFTCLVLALAVPQISRLFEVRAKVELLRTSNVGERVSAFEWLVENRPELAIREVVRAITASLTEAPAIGIALLESVAHSGEDLAAAFFECLDPVAVDFIRHGKEPLDMGGPGSDGWFFWERGRAFAGWEPIVLISALSSDRPSRVFAVPALVHWVESNGEFARSVPFEPLLSMLESDFRYERTVALDLIQSIAENGSAQTRREARQAFAKRIREIVFDRSSRPMWDGDQVAALAAYCALGDVRWVSELLRDVEAIEELRPTVGEIRDYYDLE